MADEAAFDPMSMARQWMSQWEKLTNEHGTEWLARPEAAQAMQAFAGAALKAQAASDDASSKVLAAANLPSRADIEALGQRLATVEADLLRIENHLSSGRPSAPRPAVRRTRKPPA